MEGNSLLYGLKPIVFGTAFDQEPGFKTENLIQYRIYSRRRTEF